MIDIFRLSKTDKNTSNFTKNINILLGKKADLQEEIDANLYSELMEDYKIYLYKIAYSYVKNEQTALDIIQETSYKGLVNISKLNNIEYFKTWITRILINTSINYIRSNKNIISYGELSEVPSNSLNENTDTTNMNIEDKIDLYNAIDTLKHDYKTVVILKYFNDMTEKEISKIMEIPVNTVKSHLKRAKTELRKVLT